MPNGNRGLANGGRSVGRYPIATRINSFRAGGRGVVEAVRVAARVPGVSALELNYPQHFAELREGQLDELLAETGLRLTALNLRFEGREYAAGAFTSPDRKTREQAIRTACEAVEVAGRNDANHVILWMADDGFRHPFELDYAGAWTNEVDGFGRVASWDSGTLVSVEYKPAEFERSPFNPLIRTMGEALLAVDEVGLPNFGVTLDFCHSLMAGEQPAAAAALALGRGKLFGIHLNDGHGETDDGLPVGSVNPWQTLELLALLRRFGYDGTIYFDTFPAPEEAAAECADNVATVLRYQEVIDHADLSQLATLQAHHDWLAAQKFLLQHGFEPGFGSS